MQWWEDDNITEYNLLANVRTHLGKTYPHVDDNPQTFTQSSFQSSSRIYRPPFQSFLSGTACAPGSMT